MAARIGVSMIPGETQFTRTGASSSASADDCRIRARTNAEEARHQRQRPTGTDFRTFRDAPRAPELAFHRPPHILHRHRLERAGAKLGRRDHDMIDRAATLE
jgi:hypothetical protein